MFKFKKLNANNSVLLAVALTVTSTGSANTLSESFHPALNMDRTVMDVVDPIDPVGPKHPVRAAMFGKFGKLPGMEKAISYTSPAKSVEAVGKGEYTAVPFTGGGIPVYIEAAKEMESFVWDAAVTLAPVVDTQAMHGQPRPHPISPLGLTAISDPGIYPIQPMEYTVLAADVEATDEGTTFKLSDIDIRAAGWWGHQGKIKSR